MRHISPDARYIAMSGDGVSVAGMARSTFAAAEARRIALRAQGFGAGPGAGRPGARSLGAAIGRLGLLQIDSVNVFERSHYLPLFARLGAYDRAALDRITMRRGASHVEYWAHEAAFIPRDTLPLLRWKMDALRTKDLRDADGFAAGGRALFDELRAVLRANGPMPASAIEAEAITNGSVERRGPWWGWSDAKRGLEHMFRWGDVVTAGRRGFERVYALPEQVLPAGFLESAPGRPEAQRALVERAARASGIGTVADIADYFRMRVDDTKLAIGTLVEQGVLLPVRVEGWREGAWLHRDARVPRRIEADALLSPFDPVVWFRRRAERMFDFHYRIEIYTPAPKRRYGYYVLPVLQDDRIAGRIDLKSDRQRGVLRVRTAWHEPGVGIDPGRLGALLVRTAAWQGLDAVEVTDRGTAAAEVADALGLPLVPHVEADDREAPPADADARSVA
jgi:uncharacterized protein YcaQ